MASSRKQSELEMALRKKTELESTTRTRSVIYRAQQKLSTMDEHGRPKFERSRSRRNSTTPSLVGRVGSGKERRDGTTLPPWGDAHFLSLIPREELELLTNLS